MASNVSGKGDITSHDSKCPGWLNTCLTWSKCHLSRQSKNLVLWGFHLSSWQNSLGLCVYQIEHKEMYVDVGFSFCLVLLVQLNQVQDLRNRIKFLSYHKLLPVNLTWLSKVYGKMSNFPICWFVLENVCLKILSLNILIIMADVIAML